jgi:hypothetical protein
MGIKRQATEEWTCDQCGSNIAEENRKNAVVVEVRVRGAGAGFYPPKQYAFCSKDHANAWWQNSTKENLVQ